MYRPPDGSSLKIFIVMDGEVEGGGQADCAFALLAQPRPKPSEIKNATQILIEFAPMPTRPR